MVVKEMKRAELHVIVSSNLLEIGEIQSKNGYGHEWSHGYLLKERHTNTTICFKLNSRVNRPLKILRNVENEPKSTIGKLPIW